MTIRRGEEWGRPVARPADLRVVSSDRELAVALSADVVGPISVSGGDMYRTLGANPAEPRGIMQRLPLDLMRVELGDGRAVDAVAHVVARPPARRGSWWRGEVLIVMNAEFLGDWDLAPRGHPNDGVVEVLRAGVDLTMRQRLIAARRAPTARHVPHPAIHTARITQQTWTFDAPLEVRVDGHPIGCTDRMTVEVREDAAVVYV